MSELWRLSAAALVAGYREHAFTPVDALDACLARIDDVQPRLNAFVGDHEAARRLARAAAEASAVRWRAGAALGPLDGVPIAVKDNLHVAGLGTSWGSALLRDVVATADEVPIARLRAAGAVFVGKTNCPEFAMQGHTSNRLWGTTRNPWAPALTPGGSSGGAVAGVAAGCVPLAVATDGGGSIRRPASHCGLVGYKPSAGLVARGGGLPEIFLEYEVVGAIGRTTADVAAMMAVLAARPLAMPLRADAASKSRVASAERPTAESPMSSIEPPRARRILFVPRFADHPVDAGIAARVREGADRLARLGHEIVEHDRFELAEAVNAHWPLLSSAGLAWLFANPARWPRNGSPANAAPDAEQCSDASRAALERGRTASAAELFGAFEAIGVLRQRLDAVFAEYDFLLSPATAALPWPVEKSHPLSIDGIAVGPRGHAVFTAFANAAGLPAVALPCGDVDGLPTGFQLVGRSGADAALLALASDYEARYPWTPLAPL